MAPETADRLAAVVAPGRRFARGDKLPALWHWAYFPELAPLEDLGPDGHPRRHHELARHFPRRIAGGGSLRQARGLVVGEPAERSSALVEVRERRGRSGELIICNWRHTYTQGEGTALEEIQSVIYRGAEARDDKGPDLRQDSDSRAGSMAPDDGSWRFMRRVEFGPVMLFRFSAATWNSHRIHYDRPYATEEEGYPGLLVHGPLLAILLADEAERLLGSGLSLEFRAHASTFDTDAVNMYSRPDGEDAYRMEARKLDGTVVMSLSGSGVDQQAGGLVTSA